MGQRTLDRDDVPRRLPRMLPTLENSFSAKHHDCELGVSSENGTGT